MNKFSQTPPDGICASTRGTVMMGWGGEGSGSELDNGDDGLARERL